MKTALVTVIFLISLFSCSEKNPQAKNDYILASGQMPAIAKDKENNLHLVFGMGDSIMYANSTDQGYSFSNPVLISVLPHVYDFATRGPQIAVTKDGLVVTACTSEGNIYSFFKDKNNDWQQGKRVNDEDTIAKEGLMALSAFENNAFAVWLDIRGTGRNKIYGAQSADGGRTWSKNKLIYASPDTVVCACCKPSVIVWKNTVTVMFRNWLNGNRDMYIASSNDLGNTFTPAQMLGSKNWKLDGCPMDGGNLAVNDKGEVQTVWRREAKIFSSVLGAPEKGIGEGRGCTIEVVNNDNIFAWVEKGQIVVTKLDGQAKILGKGIQPVLKAIDGNHALCIWEEDRQIHAAIYQL